MAQQQLRDDQFFDAPVELFFTVNLAMGISTKMDSAMMMQNVMITAKARGLDTYPQPTSRMESSSCSRAEYTWCCTI
jgi:nitroreductase